MRHIFSYKELGGQTTPPGTKANYIVTYLSKHSCDTVYFDKELFEELIMCFGHTFYGDLFCHSRFGRVIIKQLPDELQALA
jgi:hypothetical protein